MTRSIVVVCLLLLHLAVCVLGDVDDHRYSQGEGVGLWANKVSVQFTTLGASVAPLA